MLGHIPHNGRLPVVRLGGHCEEHETGWQCAAREVYEESGMRIRPLAPHTTYLADGDHTEMALEEVAWEHEADDDHTPLLVIAYNLEKQILLSLMYLAEADEPPTPSSEVKGLLLLERGDIHRVCQQKLTLEQYLRGGGKAILHGEFDRSLVLEPFIQLRLLSRIWLTQPEAQS